ncbi:hypothetical protein RKD30_007282 [Streptomyces pristinaespiralis]
MNDDEGRVLPFRPTGGAAPPPPPPPSLPAPPAMPLPPAPAADDTGLAPILTDEEPTHPTLVIPTPAVPPPPVPALPGTRAPDVPAVLRSEGAGNDDGGGEGRDAARSAMVVAIGVAVAALRGMTQWLGDRRQRFQDRAPVREAAAKAKADRIKAQAEHLAALQKINHGAAQNRTKSHIQSPTDFGRGAAKGGGKSGPSTGPFGAKGANSKGKPSRNTSGGLPAKKATGKTPDAQKAAAARREAKKSEARPDRKKQGLTDRMRRKGGGASGKDNSPGKSGAKKPSPKGATAPTKDGAKAKGPDGKTVGTGKPNGKAPGGKKAAGSKTKPVGLTKRFGKPKGGKSVPPKDKVALTKKPKAPKGSSTAPPKGTSPKPPPTAGEQKTKPWSGWRKPRARPASKPKDKGGGSSGPTDTGSTRSSRPGARSRRNRQHEAPPRQEPHADGEWLRPPPGMNTTYSVTITRPDREKPKKPLAAITRGRPGPRAGSSPASSSTTTTAGPTGSVPPPRKEARPMGGAPAVRDTQFTDADLTVYDVIESDQDMAQEILAGAEHAKLVTDRCQNLVSSLESLHAELTAKSVPGSLIGWCARLIERAGVVETKAEGLAAGLPRASEAIAHAGQVAADYDKHPADVVRDMGHTAPADTSYHQE